MRLVGLLMLLETHHDENETNAKLLPDAPKTMELVEVICIYSVDFIYIRVNNKI